MPADRPPPPDGPALTAAERRTLIDVARASIVARVTTRPYSPPAAGGALARRAGAFVTIKHRNALRGCIGHTARDRSLVEVVASCAAAAATEDPRFPPLAAEQVAEVAIEISLLGPIEAVTDVEAIEVGRHGLIVEDGPHRGLLLPQVATEWGWDRRALLEQTCVKAGLGPGAWASGARLFRFEAEVFGEES